MTDEHADDDRSTDTKWKKHTDDVRAWVRAPLVSVMLDDRAAVEDLRGHFEVHPTTPGTVRLSFQVDGDVDDAEVTIGGTESLTPEQAEGLADALGAAAEQARNGGADFGL